MKPRTKRFAGLALILIACLWLGFTQVLLWTVPAATASSAPDRLYPKQETFTRKELYDLSFAVARNISDCIPNILLPSALLLFASRLFHSSKVLPAPNPSNDEARNT